MKRATMFVLTTAMLLLMNGLLCAETTLCPVATTHNIPDVMRNLQGTVWRYQESKTEFTTIKFTSSRGGYFLFNRYERKFIFTYNYSDGVGTIMRDATEFRTTKDASRLASVKFLVENDTLLYDGREFVRMRGLEHTEELAAESVNSYPDVNTSSAPNSNVPTTTSVTSEEHYNGTHNSGVRPARNDKANQEVNKTTDNTVKTSMNDNTATHSNKAVYSRVEETAPQHVQEEKSERSATDSVCPPAFWAVGSDVSGFENRSVVGSMPKAAYDGRDQGKNVLRIWVDRDGNVVRAEVNQTGTTLSSNYFANKAKLVASRLHLTPNPNAARVETGFLTVVFAKQ